MCPAGSQKSPGKNGHKRRPALLSTLAPAALAATWLATASTLNRPALAGRRKRNSGEQSVVAHSLSAAPALTYILLTPATATGLLLRAWLPASCGYSWTESSDTLEPESLVNDFIVYIVLHCCTCFFVSCSSGCQEGPAPDAVAARCPACGTCILYPGGTPPPPMSSSPVWLLNVLDHRKPPEEDLFVCTFQNALSLL